MRLSSVGEHGRVVRSMEQFELIQREIEIPRN